MKLKTNSQQKESFIKNISSIKKILFFLKPYKIALIGALFSLITVSFAILTLGYAIKIMIDSGFGSNDVSSLREASVFILILISVIAIASYFRASTVNIICDKIESDIKQEIFRHIIKISPSFFEVNKVSDIMTRLTVDTTLVNNIITNLGSFVLRNFIMLVGAIIMLLITSPYLTLYIIILVPILILPLKFLGKRLKKLSRLSQEKISDINALLEEGLNGIKVIQAYNKEEQLIDQFSNTCQTYQQTSVIRIKTKALLTSLVIFLALFTVSYVINLGGYQVLKQQMTPGELSAFIFYSITVATSLGGISEVIGDLQRASAAIERIMELLHINSHIEEQRNIKNIAKNNFDIIFEEVGFYYPSRPDIKALNNISFEIKTGETIAIVGPSGAGKSTIFQLLLRFYNPSKGSIKINDINIEELSLKELRNLFALVPQEPVIFSATIYENIKFGNSEAKEEEIIQAAKTAEIFEFVQTLPNKFKTFVGEKGVRLSGGQKQRISIARAILKDPKILLLDEATSSLDTENEKLVQKALEKAKKNRTTIIIAHRFSTIENADRIIVLDNGSINAVGTHQQLIKENGLYTKLAKNIKN